MSMMMTSAENYLLEALLIALAKSDLLMKSCVEVVQDGRGDGTGNVSVSTIPGLRNYTSNPPGAL